MGFVIPAKRAITPIFDQSFEITDGLLVLGVRMNLCEQQAEPGEMPRISMRMISHSELSHSILSNSNSSSTGTSHSYDMPKIQEFWITCPA